MELLKNLIHYLPYILLFAVATMLIYGWGLWRSMHQNQDLNKTQWENDKKGTL